jgi:hypothetical protein
VPFWPEEEFAALCATAEWQGFRPKAITLEEFLARWLPGMEKDQRICLVFSTPTDRGSLLRPNDLDNLIRQELQQYE